MIGRLTNHHLPRASVRLGLALVLLISAIVGVRAADLPAGQTDPGSSPSVTPAPAAAATPTTDPASAEQIQLNGAGAKNIVNLVNRKDSRLTVRGSIQFNGIPAPRVAPVNLAAATASCVDCQTYAVALQVNIYQRGAPFVAPQNAAAAVNAACARCITVARAIQYVIPVDDIHAVPNDVRKLVHDLDTRLKAVEGNFDPATFNVFQADGQILNVIGSFQGLANDLLNESRIETAVDSPQPSASPTASASDAAASPSGSSESASPDASPTATATPEPSACPEPTATSTDAPTESPATDPGTCPSDAPSASDAGSSSDAPPSAP